MRSLNLLIVGLALLLPMQILAGTRQDKLSGFDAALGMPFPSIAGVMVGFNIGDDARISGGGGYFGRWGTYQLDAKVFLDTTPWAGYIGAGIDYLAGSSGEFSGWDLDYDTALVPYIEAGIDYQAADGFHVMFNLAGTSTSGEVIVLPGLAVGWYF